MALDPVIVVGAGVAGLACAQALAAGGRPAVVLERARGVGGRVRLAIEDGEAVEARDVVLALAAEQALGLVETMGDAGPEMHTARALLGMSRSQPCLTLLAAYGPETSAPSWHVCYPEGSEVIQIVAHDSSKREQPSLLALVIQAHARWSRAHLDDEGWPAALLAEAARVLGPWAAAPRLTQAHRWRYARTDLGAELSAPLLVGLPSGARIGIAGELFAPGGGVEAAWGSGRAMARRILAEGDG